MNSPPLKKPYKPNVMAAHKTLILDVNRAAVVEGHLDSLQEFCG